MFFTGTAQWLADSRGRAPRPCRHHPERSGCTRRKIRRKGSGSNFGVQFHAQVFGGHKKSEEIHGKPPRSPEIYHHDPNQRKSMRKSTGSSPLQRNLTKHASPVAVSLALLDRSLSIYIYTYILFSWIVSVNPHITCKSGPSKFVDLWLFDYRCFFPFKVSWPWRV